MPDEITIPGLGATKKTHLYIFGAAAAGIVGYAWYAHNRALAAVAPPADGTSSYGDSYATLSGGGAGGTTTAGLGGGSGADATVTDPDLLPPTTNIEWAQRVAKLLSERFGYDGQFVAATIGKYLARQQLTRPEGDLVRTAWGQLGRPPQGDFPILIAPDPVTPPTTPPTTPPPATDPNAGAHDEAHGWFTVKPGWHVDQWIHDVAGHPNGNRAFTWEMLCSLNGGATAVGANINWHKNSAENTFKAAHTYRVR